MKLPMKIIENTLPEETSGALAVLSSTFTVGMFLSPIFFFGVTKLLDIGQFCGKFLLAAVLFSIGMQISAALLLKKKPVKK